MSRLTCLREGLAEFLLLLLGQVGRDDLEVVLLEFVDHLVDSGRPAGEGEERRGTLRDLFTNLLDEVVVDANVGQRAGHTAHTGAYRRAQERDEEDQAEQEAPECAPGGSGSRGAV